MNWYILSLIAITCSQALLFGVFEGSISSKHNEVASQERSAFSWLSNQIFHPRHMELHPDGDVSVQSIQIRLLPLVFCLTSSLLVVESRAFRHSHHLLDEDVFWLKERIAALILLGPPPPITFGLVLSFGAVSAFFVLLTVFWVFWYHFIRPRNFDEHILLVAAGLENSLSRLRTRLMGIRESLSSPSITTSSIIRAPRRCLAYTDLEHVNRLASFTDTLKSRANTLRSQASSFLSSRDQIRKANPPAIKKRQCTLHQTSIVHTDLQPESCLNLNEFFLPECQSMPLMQEKTPIERRTSKADLDEHTTRLTEYAEPIQSVDVRQPDIDPDAELQPNQGSNGSPNENLPNYLVSPNQIDGKSTASKIPQLFRATPSHALAPLFSVMNPSTTRWDASQSSIPTPSHIPTGSLHIGSVTGGRKNFKSQLLAPKMQPEPFPPGHNSDP
ncbi:hypothetical protein FBUS_07017 [Fasciolopsis buskii]|uniref:Uncharacterized protein n=1 Tax=Fasciolopsis buskii TaxID=27845 RepID=A0A8E0VP82_9TREM|nr:hypothetical protein FBUS_07017 [Fasciolopsis buski]